MKPEKSPRFPIMGNVIAYLRCSTAGQSERHSIAQQEGQIRQWARDNAATVKAFYKEEGVSGSVWDRPQLLACVAHAKRSKMNIIITKLDRFSRDALHAALLERELNDAGVQVISLAGEGNGEEPHHQLVRGILQNVAQHERRLASQRTRAVLQHLKKQGRTLGRPPRGFKKQGDGFVPSEQYHWLKLLIIERNQNKKSLAEVAATCGCSVSFVSKLATRWPTLKALEAYREKVSPSAHSIQGQSVG